MIAASRRVAARSLILATIVTVSTAGLGVAQNAASVPPLPCPKPAVGLRHPDANVEVAPFSYDGRTFQVEVASAFAPRAGASYCLRYEAENVTLVSAPPGKERIDVFHWPLAGMSIERFEAGKYSRGSVLQTLPSAQAPAVGATELYAFKRTQFRSVAYKVSDLGQLSSNVIRASFSDRQTNAAPALDRANQPTLAQQGPRRGFTFEEATHLIGAVWQAPMGEIAATTNLDSKINAITVTIERRNYKETSGQIYAPFALALDVAKDPKQIPALLNEFRLKGIGMENNAVRFSSRELVNLRSPETRVFLVKQPIVFSKEDGSRVCFLAPTYSPVEIDPNLLSCDPERAFPSR